ncbi:hypothetical protein O1D97_12515 [Marinomonas sp. 15G1-11]|uniref:Uncharacterized protein n=1 Tax=Marinomonas phaeophyticola TaxID=3004091 RepID=A0ABT4JVM7_9GAMM|nr:hypothetical protein [Marinomonas sp. 15G1-11]MCZ2722422.1 hypothetical protein [Marinomonas sp. 15G1-11]
MNRHPLLKKALENSLPEFATVKLQRIGGDLLSYYLVKSGSSDAEANITLDESCILSEVDFEATLDEAGKTCKGRINQYQLLSLLSLNLKILSNDIDPIIVHKLMASIYYALLSREAKLSFVTIAEAADNIRLILSHRANSSKIKQIPNQLTVIETLEYFCTEITDQYVVSQAYLKMVRDGWNLCSNHKEETPSKVKKGYVQDGLN